MNANTPTLAPELKAPRIYNQQDTPWYFGAHLNQARHNLFLALNELTIKIGGNPIENDDQLQSAKALTILNAASPNPNELAKAMEYYDKNFPFLFYMQYRYETDQERDERIFSRQKNRRSAPVQHAYGSAARYFEILNTLIVYLNKARNHCNHYTYSPLTIKKDLVYLLNDVFDVNVRLIKSRFNLEEAQLDHLKRYNGIDRKTKKPKSNYRFWYSFTATGNTENISEAGLAFFTCLFLPKGEAYLFLKKLSGFKRAETPEYKATLEVFTSNMLRVPRERLESDNSPQAVFLDMCNELARCPAELFELLEEEKQELFITNRLEDEDNTDSSGDGPETKMIRKSDRFLYFAQRYLDITKGLPQMRFGVDLGMYFYSIYPKTLAGVDEMRQLTKHLIGYGRLEDFDTDKRPAAFAALYGQKEDPFAPYIRETTPHYHTDGKNIPIYIGSSSCEWPEIGTTDVKGKSYPRKLNKNNTLLPYAILSAKEMPALMLYHLLRKEKNKGDDVQKVIVTHINNVRRFFKAVLNGSERPVDQSPLPKPDGDALKQRSDKEYCRRYELLLQQLDRYALHPSYIPEKLANYLLGIAPSDWKEKAERRLNEMKATAADLVERMELREKDDIKPGKPGFRKVKVGKLAQLIVEDMMLMQPVLKDENDQPVPDSKANGLAYRLLQSHLAFYGVHRDNITELFSSCKLTGGTNPHPFLHRINVNELSGIIEFYKAYFNEKIDYLNTCLKNKRYDEYHFLKINAQPDDIADLLKTYLQTEGPSHSPFNLPRGFFHRATVNWLMLHGTESNKKFLADHPDTNTVHLTKHLFEQQDTAQAFYHWKRHYHLFSGDVPLYLNLEERKQETERTMKIVNRLREELDDMEDLAAEAQDTFYHEIKRLRSLDDIIRHTERKYGASFPAVYEIEWRVSDYYMHKDATRLVTAAIEGQIKDNKHYLNSYKFFIENEKYLRLIEAQDMLLFMAVKDLLKEKIGDISLTETQDKESGTFLLSNISPQNVENNKNLLNQRPAGGIHINLDFFEINENGSFRKSENGKVKVGTATIIDKHLKIKNAGNFRKLLKDRRINNICFYFKPDAGHFTINRMVLENEFRAYDKQRLKVLEVVAAFEEKLYLNSNKEEKATFLNNKGVAEHKLYLKHYFGKFTDDNENLQRNLLAIRNAFAHNQFPLIHDDTFALSANEWRMIHEQYQPSAQGSHQGYGIIEKISLYGINGYQSLIDKISGHV
ncbi:type VI-B CRISPR-associated RNA-guided ribonuclease Cas13b [Chitinophaga sp. S165]|uniref:type VI-B CRISPR-associated RNA-guided ribonuclease Cas13b n=1 Tax=Chitinophaga sp. S165 TaxID=2135462 RepID=UPI000D70C38B|nr:type VI-B CRISPR-associated RNA-guided ribonuclease Cas13b [Chitinophaga sp. S165]PWV56216.1 hypothetical protein C7475_101731 [Chitinophaga sp. S165]